MGNTRISEDPRIDPRIKAIFGAWPDIPNPGDARDRDQLLAEVNTEEAKGRMAQQRAMFEAMDTEQVASFQGLTIRTSDRVISQPDGNTINIQFIRPENGETLPCVYYIHGGGMQRCRVTTACTGPGAGSSPPRAWRWPWSTSATACWPHRSLR